MLFTCYRFLWRQWTVTWMPGWSTKVSEKYWNIYPLFLYIIPSSTAKSENLHWNCICTNTRQNYGSLLRNSIYRALSQLLPNSTITSKLFHSGGHFIPFAFLQALFKFEHPNWEMKSNKRFAKLKFKCNQNCVLTGFAGFFETVLYGDVMLSINPQTYTENMVSWFPIVFPLPVCFQNPSALARNYWLFYRNLFKYKKVMWLKSLFGDQSLRTRCGTSGV